MKEWADGSDVTAQVAALVADLREQSLVGMDTTVDVRTELLAQLKRLKREAVREASQVLGT